MRSSARALKQHLEGLALWGVKDVPLSGDTIRKKPLGHNIVSFRGHDMENAMGHNIVSPDRARRLAALERETTACTRCSLYRTRTQHVFGDGAPDAKLVFVGEAPGRDEDMQGKPFVGKAGQLLTKMIEAIGLRRDDVYICNVLKDRPPNNRAPEPEEVEACLPFLERQLHIIHPRVICLLGATPAKALLGPHVAITKIRGQRYDYHGIPLVPTFHPAYLLRNPPAKKFAWIDLKTVKRILEESERGS